MSTTGSGRPNEKFRIGTRGSPLALAQARELAERLAKAHPGLEPDIEIVVVQTTGDRITDRPLSEIGGKGLFTLEIEQMLATGAIAAAVHSAKDMPTELPNGLELSCYLERAPVADAFLSPCASAVDDLAPGAIVGTSSLRRQALLKRIRPDLQVVGFRGNVQTRLQKLDNGVAQATLLAVAGLQRLGMMDAATTVLDIERFPPAPGQGAICVETRTEDVETRQLLLPVNDHTTATALTCERAFLAGLDGSCRTPIAGHATCSDQDQSMHFHGLILTPDGTQAHEIRLQGEGSDAHALGLEAAARLKEQAGPHFFSHWT